MKTCAVLFAGGGLADVGLHKAGYQSVWAVEYDARIAKVYEDNHGLMPIVTRVQDVDYSTLPSIDLLWASPVCKNASSANVGATETDEDISAASAVVRAIEAHLPDKFILENVRGYTRFRGFRIIVDALMRNGYDVAYEVVNAADYGVPQTRERLIMRARRDGWFVAPLPPKQPWIGWYAAIEDLIPVLMDDEFAEWQQARLPEYCKGSIYVQAGATSFKRIRDKTYYLIIDEPARTVMSGHSLSHHRAFLLDGQTNTHGQSITVRRDSQPRLTVSATQTRRPIRAWLNQGRVVQMSARCLARFQTVPDWYVFPRKNKPRADVMERLTGSDWGPQQQQWLEEMAYTDNQLACTIIGNGVPCELAKMAAGTLD